MTRPARPASRSVGRGLGPCTRGAAAVEFAIVSGVLITLLIGILDVGRALWVQNQISFLADQAVRRVLLDPEISEEELRAALREDFTAGDAEALAIAIPEPAAGDGYRVLSIDFPFALLVPHIAGEITLGVTRRVPAD